MSNFKDEVCEYSYSSVTENFTLGSSVTENFESPETIRLTQRLKYDSCMKNCNGDDCPLICAKRMISK